MLPGYRPNEPQYMGLTDTKKELVGWNPPIIVSETSPCNVADPSAELLTPSREASMDPADVKFEPYEPDMLFDMSVTRQKTADEEAWASIIEGIRTDPIPKTSTPPPTLVSYSDDNGNSSSDEKPTPAMGRQKLRFAQSARAALPSHHSEKRSLVTKRRNSECKKSRRHRRASSLNLTRKQISLTSASLANLSSMASPTKSSQMVKRLARTKALKDVHEDFSGKTKLELIFEQSKSYSEKMLDRPTATKPLFGVCHCFDLADGGRIDIVCGSLEWTTRYTHQHVPEQPNENSPTGVAPGASPSAPLAFCREGSMVQNTQPEFISLCMSHKTKTKDSTTERSQSKESPVGRPEAVDRAPSARPPCNRIIYVPARRSAADTVSDADIITLRMMTNFRVLSERKGSAFVVEYESPPRSGKTTTRVLRLRQPELRAQFTQILSWFFYTEQEQHHNDVVYEKIIGAQDLVLSVVEQEQHARSKHRSLDNRHIKQLKIIRKLSASLRSGSGAQIEGAAGGGGDAPDKKGKSRDLLTANVLKTIHEQLYQGERAHVKGIIDDAKLVPLPRDRWLHNSAACAVCKAAFGILKRHFNCKYCGKMVCSNCSRRKHMNKRICDNCLDKPQDEAAALQAYRAPCTCERGTCALFLANIVRRLRSKIIGLLKSPSEEARLWALKLLWKMSLMQQRAVDTCVTPASSRGAPGFQGDLPLAYYISRLARGKHLTNRVVNIIFNIFIGKVSTEEAAADIALFSAKIFYVNLLPTLINASLACDVATQFAVVEKLFLILPSYDNIDAIRSLRGWQSAFFQLFMGQCMHQEIQMDRSAKVQQITAESKKKRVVSTKSLEKKSAEGKIIALTYAIFSFILRHDVLNRKVDNWEDSESFRTFAQLRSFASWTRSVRSVGCMIMVTAINGIVNKEFEKKKKRKVTVDFTKNFSHLVATLIEIMVNHPPMDGEQVAGISVEQSGRASDLELCECAMKLVTGLTSNPQYRNTFHKKGPLHIHSVFLEQLHTALENIRAAPVLFSRARALWNKTYKCNLRGGRVHRPSPEPDSGEQTGNDAVEPEGGAISEGLESQTQ